VRTGRERALDVAHDRAEQRMTVPSSARASRSTEPLALRRSCTRASSSRKLS